MTQDNRPTVLVVDDERVNRAVLAELLADECRVILAKDGPSALQRTQEERVSLVLLDASMPGMDGYEVLRRLKADDRTAKIEVIFVTGQTDEQDEERGLLLGAVDYIAKPIRPALVRARVRNHLKLARQREELELLSLRDGLTGIANRRHFDMEFNRVCRHAARSGDSLSLAMIDVDYFKQYNDRYGHGAGDMALARIAQALVATVQRPYDTAARYGGEEFVLLLPGVDEPAATLEQVRADVAALGIAHAGSDTASVLTISCGGVVARAELAREPARLLRWADEALYQAKREGRNRTIVLKP